VAELALDDDQWDAFMGHLNGVRMAQLMRREPPPYPRVQSSSAQLPAGGGRLPMSAGRRTVDDTEQRANPEPTAVGRVICQ